MANFRRNRPIKHPHCMLCCGYKRTGNSVAKRAFWSRRPKNIQPTRSSRRRDALALA